MCAALHPVNGAGSRPPHRLIYHHLLSRRLRLRTNRTIPLHLAPSLCLSCCFLSSVLFILCKLSYVRLFYSASNLLFCPLFVASCRVSFCSPSLLPVTCTPSCCLLCILLQLYCCYSIYHFSFLTFTSAHQSSNPIPVFLSCSIYLFNHCFGAFLSISALQFPSPVFHLSHHHLPVTLDVFHFESFCSNSSLHSLQ